MKHFVLIILFIYLSIHAFAQDSIDVKFVVPSEPSLFIENIVEVLTRVEREDSKKMIKELRELEKAGGISSTLTEGMAKLFTEMNVNGMQRFNYYLPPLRVLLDFSQNTNKASTHFDNWIENSVSYLSDISKQKTMVFGNYLRFCEKFWIYGFLYDKASGSHKWHATSDQFSFNYADNVLSIEYKETDLVCFKKRDSLTIFETSGIYYPVDEIWMGTKGKAIWKDNGQEEAYASFKKFNVRLKNMNYTADNATLYYPSVFSDPIEGKVMDRTAYRNSNKLLYPKFESASRDIRMKDIGKGVDFIGGFLMSGLRVKGYGDDKGMSNVYIRDKENQEVVRIQSDNFEIVKEDRIMSQNAIVTIYMHNEDGSLDSIHHPSCDFMFSIKNRELVMTRSDVRMAKVPFSNSLTQMELEASQITWQIDTDEIKIGNNKSEVDMYSANHFDERLFEKYYNINTINPIIKFYVYSQKLQQTQEDGQVNDYEEDFADDDYYCQMYPEECTESEEIEEEPLDTNFLISIGAWPPEEDEVIEEEVIEDFIEYGPRLIDASELTALLHKRLEKLHILTETEIEKARKNPKFKIVTDMQSYREFERYYPKIYKFAAIDVLDVLNLVPEEEIDVLSTLPLFMEMVKDGFIFYDKKTNAITLRDKIFHYAESVNKKNLDHDFDKIKIRSMPKEKETDKTNAVLNLKTSSLETYGVESFVLSDSQNVVVIPFEGKVDMKSDRDMEFDGTMTGGFCTFTGEDFYFKYDIFHVEMDTIDFVDIYIHRRARHGEDAGVMSGRPKPEREIDPATGFPTLNKEPIQSIIEGGGGVLLIDVPSNKSGRSTSSPIYPSYDCVKRSRVYYDKKNRLGLGVYPKDSFYYELEPFIMNGLDNLDPNSLVFNGKLFSANIFHPITEKLRVMYHDLSLGFETETRGNDPNPVYLNRKEEGEGKFIGNIGISNEGFIGNGRLDFLGAAIESEYVEFRPNQFIAENVDTFELEKETINGYDFPMVKGQNVQIDWIPYSDSMAIMSSDLDKAKFNFFSDSIDFGLNGILALTPFGVKGKGIFDWYGATLESNTTGDFKFQKNGISSSSSSVVIKSKLGDGSAFKNSNVEFAIDFDKQTGDFKALKDDLSTDLPHNSYQTTLSEFHWDMKKNNIQMDAGEDGSGFFLAMNNSQDSLIFSGTSANYNIDSGILVIDGVDSVKIADAFIYPSNDRIVIEQGSKMKTLNNAVINCDTSNLHHKIKNATVHVLSRTDYTAKGFLEFNIKGQPDQIIPFDDIRVKEREGISYTEGYGFIDDSLAFTLDKGIQYKGNVIMKAMDENLRFKGYAKLNSQHFNEEHWFSINSNVNKNGIHLEFDEPVTTDGLQAVVGIFLATDSFHVYPRILEPLKSKSDLSLFHCKGILKYNPDLNQYILGDSSQVYGQNNSGKMLTYDENTSYIITEGLMDFNNGFQGPSFPLVRLDMAGEMKTSIIQPEELTFNSSINFQLDLPNQIRDQVIQDLQSIDELIEYTLYNSVNNKSFESQLLKLIQDEKKYDRTWKKIVDDERLVLPGDYPHTFFFVNTEMKWSPKTESFVSTSKRLQLGAINGKHVGQLLKGHIEILNDPVRGDIFSFYFVSPQGDWYYFSYQAGILKTISSNPSYVNLISSMKSKDKRIKSENGNYLEIVLATAAEYSAFKNKTIQAFTAEDTFDEDFDDSFDDFDEDDFDEDKKDDDKKEDEKKEEDKKENEKKKGDVKTDINTKKDKTKKKKTEEEEEEW